MPKHENISDNQKEYIDTLEMIVSTLRSELEQLRSSIKTPLSSSKIKLEDNKNIDDGLSSDFNACTNFKAVVELLHSLVADKYSIIESNIFYLNNKKRFEPLTFTDTSGNLNDTITSLEEQGIMDWALDKKIPSIIPNPTETSLTNLIIVPMIAHNAVSGAFAAVTSLRIDDFIEDDFQFLIKTCELAAVAIENIKSSEEISNMNKRLSALNRQMMKSTRLFSIGELAASFINEIDSPLQIIKVNLNLIKSGVGDSSRRLDIATSQVDKIIEIKTRLAGLSDFSQPEIKQEPLNICNLIDEVLLFSSSQLDAAAINLIKNYDDTSLKISGLKPHLEHVFLNLLLTCRNAMPEGGSLTITVSKWQLNKVAITVADSGIGFTEEEVVHIFDTSYFTDSFKNELTTGLNFTRNIIQQHKGSIRVYSEPGKGTTFRIILPLIN